MPTVAFKAHFNGDHIVLDEPFDLPPHWPLIVTLLPQPDTERADWEALAVEGLARAYSPDEPDYSLADIKRPL
ncbi:hypothetical protein LBMAG57_36460 [Verrucomicrobiota bacterium]|nr:hypothetical protein LBMAG57_36460 [Verrucomicrobiota bacterium]GDY22435.1 hypothetical protein LBMAG56_37820 [Verrucomicrobiota bacterium]